MDGGTEFWLKKHTCKNPVFQCAFRKHGRYTDLGPNIPFGIVAAYILWQVVWLWLGLADFMRQLVPHEKDPSFTKCSKWWCWCLARLLTETASWCHICNSKVSDMPTERLQLFLLANLLVNKPAAWVGVMKILQGNDAWFLTKQYTVLGSVMFSCWVSFHTFYTCVDTSFGTVLVIEHFPPLSPCLPSGFSWQFPRHTWDAKEGGGTRKQCQGKGQ